jgi:SAM-dependent methyltransferase
VDALAQFKQLQKEMWGHFAPLEAMTIPAAARLVQHAGVKPGMHVLDVGCGTGVVAITAARLGARATAIDISPQLLERARENARIAEADVDFREADAEELPFGDAHFDAVLSQFAHIFAPRPEVAIGEMLRVLKPGGAIAFSTWPPELFMGQMFALTARYMPPPPPGVSSPILWGDATIIRERLGSAVKDIHFEREMMLSPGLSPQHFRGNVERTAGPIIKMVESLSATAPDKLQEFRREFDALVEKYHQGNTVRQGYLMTRATKV